MTELNKIESIIIRSLDGTASLSELAELNEWMKASDSNTAQYFRMKDVWDSILEEDKRETQFAWKQFKKETHKGRKIRNLGNEMLKLAAVAALAFMIGYLVFEMPFAGKKEIQYTTISVPNGSKSSIELPDGSTVILNSGSRFTYPSSFEKSLRQVKLEGEGYFKVAHNKEQPFVITAGELHVKVLGTEFNVMAYPKDKRIETTLVSGKVLLNHKDNELTSRVILKPGQKAIYSDGTMTIKEANIDMATQWMHDGFYFQNTSFIELMTRLERWHNVEIIIQAEDFEDITFTGKFRNHETIWQVLDAIKLTTPINYKVQENKIYIQRIKKHSPMK